MNKKIIQNKKVILFLGVILFALVVFFIFGNRFFYTDRLDFDISSGSLQFKKVKELDRSVLLYGTFFIFIFIKFLKNILWKLEYDDTSFSLKYNYIEHIEYSKIVSVVHYREYRYRRSTIDKIIITYLAYPDFGYEEGLDKAVITYFPHIKAMKQFFSFMKEQNPKVNFSLEEHGKDGPQEFDYFAK